VGTVPPEEAPWFLGHLVSPHRACRHPQAVKIDQLLRVGFIQATGKPRDLGGPEGRFQDLCHVPSLIVTKDGLLLDPQLPFLDFHVNPVELEIRGWGPATGADPKQHPDGRSQLVGSHVVKTRSHRFLSAGVARKNAS
jgi:hypothetical protein